MKFNQNLLKKRWVAYSVALCIAVLFYLGLSHINLLFIGARKFSGIVRPVFIGMIIAYVLDPLVKVFEHYVFRRVASNTVRRNLSVLCGWLSVLVGIVFLMIALIPQIIGSIVTFAENIETYANGLQNLLNQLESQASGWSVDVSSILEYGENFLDKILANLPQNLNSILQTTMSLGQGVFSVIIGCILAVYFLADKERLLTWFRNLFRLCLLEKTYKESAVFWGKCHHILIRYIICDLMDGVIVGLANAVFMTFGHMSYIALISVVIGVTNLAPTFGPIVGAIIGSFILVLVNPWHALWFLIFTVIIQTVDGYVIKPKLFGSSLGVSGVWILICIVVGGRMFGVAGILLAIPFAAISDFVYNEYITVKLSEWKARREARASHAISSAVPQQVVEETVTEAGKMVPEAIENGV